MLILPMMNLIIARINMNIARINLIIARINQPDHCKDQHDPCKDQPDLIIARINLIIARINLIIAMVNLLIATADGPIIRLQAHVCDRLQANGRRTAPDSCWRLVVGVVGTRWLVCGEGTTLGALATQPTLATPCVVPHGGW